MLSQIVPVMGETIVAWFQLTIMAGQMSVENNGVLGGGECEVTDILGWFSFCVDCERL